MKYTFYIDVHSESSELVSFNLNLMIDMTKLYSLIMVE